MSSRRWLIAVTVLSATLHVVGMARSPLPAQDGLKFLRFARDFQARPWADVVRSADQHPLYPALIALAEPITAAAIGKGPDAWRVAAQGVSVLAALALLWPLHAMTRRLFDGRAADLAVLLYALLPFPAAIGHDTLSDSLALSLTVASLCLGEAMLRARSWLAAVGCGAVAGLGFLARPEVALVPPMVVIASLLRRRAGREELAMAGRLVALSAAVLAFVGGYAAVKGELSEKLSIRWSTSIGVGAHATSAAKVALPSGLDNARFDFSPKEESTDDAGLFHRPLASAKRLGREYAEGLAYVLIPLAVLGLARSRSAEGSSDGRRLLLLYLVAFSAIAIRHASTLGYLSGRHALSLIVATVPFAAAGIVGWVEGFPARRGLSPGSGRRLGYAGMAALAVVGAVAQAKVAHPSRWGHRAAGVWLAEKATPADAVLDTRGWATFVRGIPGYDYWHVRQALADSKLKYVVVGEDELKAPSRRAATLRAVLAYAGKPVAEFPGREDGRGTGVKVFEFRPPASWEGVRP